MSKKYGRLLKQLRPLLPELLRKHGRDPDDASGKIACLNPEHKDENPSCSLIKPDRERYYCHACGASGDIFSAAHLLEGRPLTGKEFLTDNVFALAEQFSIAFEPMELDENVRKGSDALRAYDLAAAILNFSDDATVANDVYGWELERVREVEPHIGTVEWKHFAKRMKELGGYTQVYLETIGITSMLFDEHLLTFAIKTHKGVVRGFAARDQRYGTSPRVQKWKNTPGEVAFFEKGKMLYGLDVAINESGPLYLVEGYTDVIELRMRGLRSVAAYMGSKIGRKQAEALRAAGRKELIICPDQDENEAGIKGILASIDTVFPNIPDLRIRVKTIPLIEGEDNTDPGNYIRQRDLTEFLSLPDEDGFTWRLGKFPEDMPAEDICDKVMPVVLEERNPVQQEKMLKQLALRTETRLPALQRLLDEELERRKREGYQIAKTELDRLKTKLQYVDPTEAPGLLRDVAKNIENVQDPGFSSQVHGAEETERFIADFQQECETRGGGLPGFETGYPTIDEVFGGIPRQESMIVFAGDGNVGKSAIVQNLALKVAVKNTDVCVLFYTIDDTRKQTLPRLVAQQTGIKIGAVIQPENETFRLTEDDRKKLQKAWTNIRQLVQDGRFDIKDASQGNTLDFARAWIQHTQTMYPSRHIVFVLDNFHRLGGVHGQDERQKLEEASTTVADFTKQLGITALCTMELRKRQAVTARPRIEELKGSKQFEYDANAVVMVHSPLHAQPENEDAQAWFEDGERKPILQCFVDKNKITGVKGCKEFKLRPETCQLLENDDPNNRYKMPAGVPDDD
jgi:DNA primase/KaiC/GvpD/RAD55 family RecA-like ATPase